MTDTMEPTVDLTSLDAIRQHFRERQKASGKGFHALGEEVLQRYGRGNNSHARPVSAMTFRNFLQGKTTLRDPTGLELYFSALGASTSQMRTIRTALQRELDRRLASPRQEAALRAFKDTEIDTMRYSRALAECETVTRIEDSVAAPLTHLTPREYLLGPDGRREADTDPDRWGLIHTLEALANYLERLELKLADGMAEIPERDSEARKLRLAADVRETMSGYAHWLMHHPRAAELFFSRRRYMLHGFFADEHRQTATALAKRCAKLFYFAVERFAAEVVVGGKQPAQRLASPAAENALERATERLLGLPQGFYIAVAQGSLGTGAGYQAAYQLRRDNRDHTGDWSPAHQSLVTDYDSTVSRANSMLERDVQVTYGELKDVYDRHEHAAMAPMYAIWLSDYAPRVVREAGTLCAHSLHEAGVLSDRQLLSFLKLLCTSARGRQLCAAAHEGRLFE